MTFLFYTKKIQTPIQLSKKMNMEICLMLIIPKLHMIWHSYPTAIILLSHVVLIHCGVNIFDLKFF